MFEVIGDVPQAYIPQSYQKLIRIVVNNVQNYPMKFDYIVEGVLNLWVGIGQLGINWSCHGGQKWFATVASCNIFCCGACIMLQVDT